MKFFRGTTISCGKHLQLKSCVTCHEAFTNERWGYLGFALENYRRNDNSNIELEKTEMNSKSKVVEEATKLEINVEVEVKSEAIQVCENYPKIIV